MASRPIDGWAEAVDTAGMTGQPPQVTLVVQSVFFFEDSGAGWAPADPENFSLAGMVFAGVDTDGPADAFTFELCTPAWLLERFNDPAKRGKGRGWFVDDKVLIGRGLILVRRWDRDLVERALREAFATVTAPTWQLASDRVGRLVPWEFDYKHDQDVDQAASNP